MNEAMPTMPSLPTTATSVDEPFSVMYKIDTTAVIGKYTWVSSAPDSCSTRPNGISTSFKHGNQRT